MNEGRVNTLPDYQLIISLSKKVINGTLPTRFYIQNIYWGMGILSDFLKYLVSEIKSVNGPNKWYTTYLTFYNL